MTNSETNPTVAPGNHAKVANRVKTLQSVYQIEGSFKLLRDRAEPPYAAAMMPPQWNFVRIDENTLRVEGLFGFLGHHESKDKSPPADPEDAIVQIFAKLAATYVLEDGESFTNEDADAFANINAHLNLYPFWRQFVYESLGRAGLSPFLIPPFNPIKQGILRPKSVTKSK